MLNDSEFSLLLERFKVQPYNKKSKSSWTFEVDGKDYFVYFEPIQLEFDNPTKSFEVSFSRTSKQNKNQVQYGINTNDVDATDVYWTVSDIVKDHYLNIRNNLKAMGFDNIAYYFNAARSDKDVEDTPQRAKITNKIIKRYFMTNPDISKNVVDDKEGISDRLIVINL